MLHPTCTWILHSPSTPPRTSSNCCRILCSFVFVPSSSSLRSFCGLLPRTPCCISSSAIYFASPAGGGNGGAGIGDCGGVDGSGGESGDANLKLVGDVAQELSGLSLDVIILDVSMLHRTCDISVCCPSSLGLRKDGEGRVATAVAYATKGTAERGFAVAGVEGGFCRARVHGLLLVVVAAFISRKRITSSRRNKGNDYLSEAILKLLGCNIDDPENLLVYEFVPRGNLDQVLFVIVGLGKVSIGSFSYGIRYGCPLP
ncbi:hypothetical protein GYH30_039818 [Glycine max]|nr:hypothetical protein GYH30_039818 [Glycine max]